MSQWIGSRDVGIHMDDQQAAAMPVPVMQGWQRSVSGRAQPSPAEPPRPAWTGRFPGFPSAVMTQQEALGQRTVRPPAIQPTAQGRMAWPEHAVSGNLAEAFPVHDGMLDGKPQVNEAVSPAPVIIPEPEEYEEEADPESENTVLAVYGVEGAAPVRQVCDVAVDLKEVLARLTALEERIAQLEGKAEQGETPAVSEFAQTPDESADEQEEEDNAKS